MSDENQIENEDDLDLEEGHDMLKAEDQSVASVKAAATSTKKAPKRKSTESDKQDPTPKMDKKNALPENSYDYSEELNALVESEETLSEEFKAKTAILFETAIRSTLTEELERLEEEYATKLDEEVATVRAELEDKVDSYLNYVVENWIEENKLAVQSGLRTEVTENFMEGLKNLFLENYIEVPESKIDLVDELAVQVEDLETKLDESTAAALEMTALVESLQRENVIREATRDLAETQVEKLRGLVESLDFADEETFAGKVKVVKESYFKKSASSDDETLNEEWDNESTTTVSSVMEGYTSALKKLK